MSSAKVVIISGNIDGDVVGRDKIVGGAVEGQADEAKLTVEAIIAAKLAAKKAEVEAERAAEAAETVIEVEMKQTKREGGRSSGVVFNTGGGSVNVGGDVTDGDKTVTKVVVVKK